jgi:hypothetical protein
LYFGAKPGPVREVLAASACGSQVLAPGSIATALWVRWPGGKTNLIQLTNENRELVISEH